MRHEAPPASMGGSSIRACGGRTLPTPAEGPGLSPSAPPSRLRLTIRLDIRPVSHVRGTKRCVLQDRVELSTQFRRRRADRKSPARGGVMAVTMTLRCDDLLPGCQAVIEGHDVAEIMRRTADHAR